MPKAGQAAECAGKSDDDDDDDEEEEEEEQMEVETSVKGRRSIKGKVANDQENKENSRSKRSRNDDDEDLDLNVGEMDELLKGLIQHDDGWPFDRPITKADAPDYHLYIKNPMDLSTIRTRLDGTTHYTRNQEILDDIRLVFANCIKYNREDAEEYQCAVNLEKFFDKELKRIGIVDEEKFPKVPKSKKRRA